MSNDPAGTFAIVLEGNAQDGFEPHVMWNTPPWSGGLEITATRLKAADRRLRLAAGDLVSPKAGEVWSPRSELSRRMRLKLEDNKRMRDVEFEKYGLEFKLTSDTTGILEELAVAKSVLAPRYAVRPVLNHLAVDPSWRRRGLATALCAEVEQVCIQEWGHNSVVAAVEEDNYVAIQLFEKLGYQLSIIDEGFQATRAEMPGPTFTQRVMEVYKVPMPLRLLEKTSFRTDRY